MRSGCAEQARKLEDMGFRVSVDYRNEKSFGHMQTEMSTSITTAIEQVAETAEELLGGGPRNDKITKAERASLKSLRNAWSRR